MNYSRQQPPVYRDPDFSADFSELNWRLRPNPRMSATEQLYCSLSRLPSKSSRRGPDKPLRRTASFSETEDDGPSVPDSADHSRVPDSADHSRVPDSAGHSRVPDASGSDVAPDQGRSDSPTLEGGDTPFQRSYGTLPDLINSGRPLSRRRTVGHVNDTLKEVRREVELSRRRSMKLKAQVDKLQESRHGPKWSQDQERVTEEVLSILRLMQLMSEDSGSRLPEPLPSGENRLDAALAQLQDIARKMAVSGIAKKDAKSTGGSSSADSALLQQALRDRDDAIEKKKAMEAELLRSKSEMMLLNNQLLEAAQKRLELSLELEAWKDDVQLLLHQQLLLQQQVDQNQKKPSRMGILRRNKPPVQRPANFPVAPAPASPASPVSPTQNSTQNLFSRPQLSPTSPTQATSGWRKWNKSNGGRPSVEAPQRREDDGFQVVSLD